MMRRRILSALLAASLSSLVSGSAVLAQGKSKPAPPPTNVSVTSTVADVDNASLTLLRSDGLGAYATVGNVVSQIYASSGDWELDLSSQAVRTVDLTLATIDGSPSAVPGGRYNARLISRCFAADGTITGYLQIPEGGSNSRCAMRVNFTAGGTPYFLVMSPLYAGTSWVTVSCPADADANSTCERWTVKPDPGVAVPVASLYKTVRSKEVLVGSYQLTFAIEATAP